MNVFIKQAGDYYSRLFVMMICLLLSQASYASTSATQRLDQFVKQTHTFTADFNQVVIDGSGKLVDKASGKFWLQRPGKFRWNYTKPYEQQIVADGKNIWFYDVDLEQVTVKSQQAALSETPASLLSGQSLPNQKYTITDQNSSDGMDWVKLVPKSKDSSFQSILLAFDKVGLREMIMQDNFDQKTRLIFTHAEENTKLDAKQFQFTPPKGVDVVGETAK